MKRFWLMMLTATVVTGMAISVQAAGPRNGGGQRVSPAGRDGFFGRLMEMERRKNAALRRMISG